MRTISCGDSETCILFKKDLLDGFLVHLSNSGGTELEIKNVADSPLKHR